MKRVLIAALLAASLTGCATRWVVDSNVNSFSNIDAVAVGSSYRFERLPSQQASEASQQQLEAMAGAALEGVGLRRDDASARYTAEIGARVTTEISPWADPWLYGGGPWGPSHRYGGAWGYGRGWHYGALFPPPSNPWYAREVSVVLRELPSHRVVYETHARNDGPYAANGAVLPVMFRAALRDFPHPPSGERRVDIEIPTARN